MCTREGVIIGRRTRGGILNTVVIFINDEEKWNGVTGFVQKSHDIKWMLRHTHTHTHLDFIRNVNLLLLSGNDMRTSG